MTTAVRPEAGAHGGARLVAVTFVAPVAWLVHLGTGVALVPLACETGAEWPLHLLTVVTALVAAPGTLASKRSAVRAAGRYRCRTAFVGRVGVALGVVFTILILAEGVAPLVLDPCR